MVAASRSGLDLVPHYGKCKGGIRKGFSIPGCTHLAACSSIVFCIHEAFVRIAEW